MPTNHQTKSPRRPEDSPVAWFVMLEDARNRGDAAAEQCALIELRRLVRQSRMEPATAGGTRCRRPTSQAHPAARGGHFRKRGLFVV